MWGIKVGLISGEGEIEEKGRGKWESGVMPERKIGDVDHFSKNMTDG